MKGKRRKSASTKQSNNGSEHRADFLLLELPVEVLHQVLDRLGPRDLVQLLQTSKAMAIEVMQHSAGRLTFQARWRELRQGVKLRAIRQLQWAPPSSLKLELNGVWGYLFTSNWNDVLPALREALITPGNHQGQHMQQLPCIAEACIKWFHMPDLVPVDLLAICPNMHTLRLSQCHVQDYNRDSTTICSSSSSSSSREYGSSCPATHLHTLILAGVRAPCLMGAPPGNARVTRSMQPAVRYAEQLRSSLPNVKCLKLLYSEADQVVSIFAPQLTELHDSGLEWMSDMSSWRSGMDLQQLQKLVLPSVALTETDMKTLLSLPSLTHLEIRTLQEVFTQDFSSYPCKWQYLHLRDDVVVLATLAKLPLHSLTHPLELGGDEEDEATPAWLKVQLPLCTKVDDVPVCLERLATQLKKCGVQMWQPINLMWECDVGVDLSVMSLGAYHARALALLAPAFGPQTRVSLQGMILDKPILEALATGHGSSLKQLVPDVCAFAEDMLPAWHAALCGLPGLLRVELRLCSFANDDVVVDDEVDAKKAVLVRVVRELAVAVAQQPAGRYIDVAHWDRLLSYSSEEFAKLVVSGAGAMLAGVEVTAEVAYEEGDQWAYDGRIRITSKQSAEERSTG